MDNLFLRKKENWFAWFIWAALGALLTLYVAITTTKLYLIFATALGVLALLTLWMQRSRQFHFGRAFKVCFFVLVVSLLPAVFFVIIPHNTVENVLLVYQVAGFLIANLFICLICSWIACKPKQYY